MRMAAEPETENVESGDEHGMVEVDRVEEVVRTPAVEAKPPVVATADEVKQLRAELKRSEKARGESDRTAQYWATMARTAPAATPAAKPAAVEPKKPTVDLVDALTSGDHELIARGFREMGFVSEEEVDQRIGATRAQITQEAKLLRDYPELEDDKSALWERTGTIYQDLARDPALKGSPRLIELAARTAKAELSAEGVKPTHRAPRVAVDIDDEAEAEFDRQERVGRQAGASGRGRSRGDEQPEALSIVQKSIVAKLQAAGADIDEDRYRARAKAGVIVGGLRSAAPRRKAA